MTNPTADQSTEIGHLLALITHDLRNPAATIGTNVAFVRGVVPGGDTDLLESLADVEEALGDMVRGLRHLGRVSRWLIGGQATEARDGDVCEPIVRLGDLAEGGRVRVIVPSDPLDACGGTLAGELLEVLVANSAQHAPEGFVDIVAGRAGEEVVITITDTGRAVGEDLRGECFTLAAQERLKARIDGRYGRAAGLFAAGLIANAAGAQLEAGGVDGAAVFTIRLQRAQSSS